MKWEKSSPDLLEAFERLMSLADGAEKRKMFGYPTGYVNGNWFVGCYQGNEMVLRLPEHDRQEFLALDGARQFEPMPGRVMREFVVVPWWLINDTPKMREWIQRSMAYSSTLPKQEKKGKKRR